MAQFGRPDTDITVVNWSPTPSSPTTRWDKVDEVSASDSDHVENTVNTNYTLELALSTITDPSSASGHIVRVRNQRTAGGGSGTAYLYDGSTQICSFALSAGAGWASDSYTLTAGEANNIGDYSDLRIRVIGKRLRVSWMEFEVPDAGAIGLAGVSNGGSGSNGSAQKIGGFSGLAQGAASVVGTIALIAGLSGLSVGGSTATGDVNLVSGNIVTFAGQSGFVAADKYNERFIGSGYQETDWGTATVGSGSEFDPDSIFQGRECLKVKKVSPNHQAFNTLESASILTKSFTEMEVYISEESIDDGEEIHLLWGSNTGFSTVFFIDLNQASGQLRIIFDIRHDGSSNPYPYNISTGQWYKVGILWDDDDDVWGIWLDGEWKNGGSITGSLNGVEHWRVGDGSYDEEVTAYFRSLRVSSEKFQYMADSKGSLTRAKGFAGSSAGSSTSSATLSPIRGFAGQSDGSSTVSGSISPLRYFSGSSSGLSSASASLQAARSLNGSSGGVAVVSGDLTIVSDEFVTFAGVSSGSGGASGAISPVRSVSGISEGGGVGSGKIEATKSLSGLSEGQGGASGDLSVEGLISLEGISSGIGGAVASLEAEKAFKGQSDGEGISEGAVEATKSLKGLSSGEGDAVGDLTVEGEISLAGVSSGQGGASAKIEAIKELEGGSEGSGDSAGDVEAIKSLKGQADGEGDAIGDLSVEGTIGLAGVSSGGSSASGSIVAIREFEGVSNGVGLSSGALTWLKYLAGLSEGSGDAEGVLNLIRSLSGLSGGSGDIEGFIEAIKSLKGLSEGSGDAIGELWSLLYPILFEVEPRKRMYDVKARERLYRVEPRDREIDEKKRGK